MSFSTLMGLTVDYRVATAPSSTALVDYSTPGPPSCSILTDYLSQQFVTTTVQADYAVVDGFSSLLAYTPERTYILVTEHFETPSVPIGCNVGEGFENTVPMGVSIRSTNYETTAALGLGISSTEYHELAALSAVIGTEHLGNALPVGVNVGTAGDPNTVPIGMAIEKMSRRLDVEVSIITTELQEVEEEP